MRRMTSAYGDTLLFCAAVLERTRVRRSFVPVEHDAVCVYAGRAWARVSATSRRSRWPCSTGYPRVVPEVALKCALAPSSEDLGGMDGDVPLACSGAVVGTGAEPGSGVPFLCSFFF